MVSTQPFRPIRPKRHDQQEPEHSTLGYERLSSEVEKQRTRRARRSEIEKKSRQRHQGSIQSMRKQLSDLETKYDQLTGETNCQESVGMWGESKELSSSCPTSRLKAKYFHAARIANELRQEQHQLRTMIHEKQLFSDSMKTFDMERRMEGDRLWQGSGAALFTKWKEEDVFAYMRETYKVVTDFDMGTDFQTSGVQLFGWTDKRKLDRDNASLQFQFSKQFPRLTAEKLMLQSWNMYRDEYIMQRHIFSSSVEIKMQVLQEINDDVCIVRRQTWYVAMNKRFQTVYLLYRIQKGDGYVICFRSIPAPGLQAQSDNDVTWIDLFHWNHYQRARDENGNVVGCEIGYGGSLNSNANTFASFWMIEMINTVMRWETYAVGPLFIAT